MKSTPDQQNDHWLRDVPFSNAEGGEQQASASRPGAAYSALVTFPCPRPPLLSHFTPHRRILPRRLLPSRGTIESSPPLTSYSAGALCAHRHNLL